MEEIKDLRFWLQEARHQVSNTVKEILELKTESNLKELFNLTHCILDDLEMAELKIQQIEKKLPF